MHPPVLPVLQAHHPLCPGNCLGPVGHDDARQRQLRQRLRHPVFVGNVQVAGGFVQCQHPVGVGF